MTIDLLGRLSGDYITSLLQELRTLLEAGEDPGNVERQFYAAILECENSPRNPWEFETWVAMHQRILVHALADWIINQPPKRKGRQKRKPGGH